MRIDDVLDANRNAVQHAKRRSLVKLTRRADSCVAVQMRPCLHRRLALSDAFEAIADERFTRQTSRSYFSSRLGGAHAMGWNLD